MSAIDKIAFYLNRRDEVPNQDLARELAAARDQAGVAEIAAGLTHKNRNVQSDCLKVLYELGYLAPELIADYVGDFLTLLGRKNNRLVWGAMIALAMIAPLRPREIAEQADAVIRAVERGSVITVVWGVRVMAQVSAADPAYRERFWPALMKQLQTRIPRDAVTHAESMLCAVDESRRAEFLATLDARRAELTPAQEGRLKKVLKKVGTG